MAAFYENGSTQSYGTGGGLTLSLDHKKHFASAARRRLSFAAILVSLMLPTALYAGVNAALSFSLHYDQPMIVKLIVGGACGGAFVIVYLASQSVRRRWHGESDSFPAWYIFLAVTSIIGVVAAVVMGSSNYWNNTRPYCEINNLSYYPSVDPAVTTGMQLMDAGRVTFVEGSRIDTAKTMAFKNNEQYCVAPIVSGNETAASYDLWAVGLNCCATDFHCGEYNNPSARSGLRLVREDQQGFFLLSVQQAEATYGLPIKNPLFFYWMQDPISDLAAYQEDAIRFYVLGLVAFVLFQVASLVLAMLTFRKLGIQ